MGPNKKSGPMTSNHELFERALQRMPGVTIERKEGHFTSPAGTPVRLLDLPGAYSLSATTPDEAITRDVVGGLRRGDPRPDDDTIRTLPLR